MEDARPDVLARGKPAGLLFQTRRTDHSLAFRRISGERSVDGLNSEFSKDLWTKVLSMGAVGSATMTAAIVLAGCVGIAFSPAVLTILGNSYLYALGGVVLVLAVVYALFPKALKNYVALNYPLLLESTMQSLVRLACWCVQLGLVLYALGAMSNVDR